MFLPHEINRIKDQRRLKQKGIKNDEVEFNLEANTYYYDSGVQSDGADNNEEKDLEGETVGFEPFHMKNEMRDGAFDDEGNYVERRSMTSTNRSLDRNDEDDDPWMKSLGEAPYLAQKGKHEAVYKRQPKRPLGGKPDLLQVLEGTPTIDIIKRLIGLLESGQTPVDAIKERQKSGAKRRCLPGMAKGETKVETKVETKDEDENTKSSALASMSISDLSHVLTIIWQNVYYMTKEDIIKTLARARNRPEGESGPAPKKYEFKWTNGDDKIYGPSTDLELLRWIANDYISDSNPVVLRMLNSDGKPVSEEWLDYKQTDVYTFLNPKKSEGFSVQASLQESGFGEDSPDDYEEEDDYAFKKHRKVEFIVTGSKKRKHEDSPLSDDDPNVE
ncbi:hypothetical protein BgAZ_109730 [Babesia gibsoni]|uniref:GYF domain-containing protein n=1 Tax=Babesia gibsoni TaxID=33632 RepID=A0AAD8PGY7_BABGI|nr:hypothetical protein BgAZ_109730 [Babesia gibsoni]